MCSNNKYKCFEWRRGHGPLFCSAPEYVTAAYASVAFFASRSCESSTTNHQVYGSRAVQGNQCSCVGCAFVRGRVHRRHWKMKVSYGCPPHSVRAWSPSGAAFPCAHIHIPQNVTRPVEMQTAPTMRTPKCSERSHSPASNCPPASEFSSSNESSRSMGGEWGSLSERAHVWVSQAHCLDSKQRKYEMNIEYSQCSTL